MTVETQKPEGKKPENAQRQTVRVTGFFPPYTISSISEGGVQPLETEQAETGQIEAPREENWISRLYGLLGLAELRRKFPHGTYSAIGEYASKGAISEIGSPDQDTK